jgi:hypothetical protein
MPNRAASFLDVVKSSYVIVMPISIDLGAITIKLLELG